jgi:calcium release-activated calcium channel protein 1
MLNVAASTASLLDVELSRKTRDREIQWRSEDIEFRREERSFRDEQRAWRREEIKWRVEDLKQRAMDNRRREIDEKNEQLRSIANIAALIGGFDMVVLVELNIPPNTPEVLLAFWVLSCSLTICCMTYSFVTTTLMLVGTIKKFEINNTSNQDDVVGHKTRFILFWENSCQADWERSVTAFSFGMASFMWNLVLVGYVTCAPRRRAGERD